jgi:protein-L-isoaspartate(D-aspartate) O-methyltransferase
MSGAALRRSGSAFLGIVLLAGFAGFAEEDPWRARRQAMVDLQIAARGVDDPSVLAAMRKIPRHLFVPESVRGLAYEDHPLPIGEGQTISQPYIVAFMTAALGVMPGDRILEVGTGSGYQAAVLAEIGASVLTLEIVPGLAARSERLLRSLGYDSVKVRAGDGFFGWPEEAPFDGVILTCATPETPAPLFAQLREGGRMILPLESESGGQVLTRIVKKDGRPRITPLLDVRFVPMTGEARRD